MLGSLHLDNDEEPRRGASRANSVRFDESALHSHFGQGSRASADFLPIRTGSGFGSHPMSERSTSHKSEGRQSSTHSARASTFGFESRPLSANATAFVPLGPPPGLFILGPVPSIIRCWLDDSSSDKFSAESLLYAAVCTGSYKSILDLGLLYRLGYENKITTDREGQRVIRLPVYLPEATIQQSSARSSSPAPSVPAVTTLFTVQDTQCKKDVIQVFIGCDMLRAQNADIHFSLDRLTLFDDDRNKLSVPLVRPENASSFQTLQTAYVSGSSLDSSFADLRPQVSESSRADVNAKAEIMEQPTQEPPKAQEDLAEPSMTSTIPQPSSSKPSVMGFSRKALPDRAMSSSKVNTDLQESEKLTNGTIPDTPTRSESSNVWGSSWRRDSAQERGVDASTPGANSSSGYQRAGRGRGMKVLRPSRVNTSRSASAQQQPVGFDAAPSRFGDSPRFANDENTTPASDRRSFSGDLKTPLSGKSKSANPLGGASAFGWMNAQQQKQSTGID